MSILMTLASSAPTDKPMLPICNKSCNYCMTQVLPSFRESANGLYAKPIGSGYWLTQTDKENTSNLSPVQTNNTARRQLIRWLCDLQSRYVAVSQWNSRSSHGIWQIRRLSVAPRSLCRILENAGGDHTWRLAPISRPQFTFRLPTRCCHQTKQPACTLQEYPNMLLGANVDIYTDHKSHTYSLTLYSTQRALRWRVYIEEYALCLHTSRARWMPWLMCFLECRAMIWRMNNSGRVIKQQSPMTRKIACCWHSMSACWIILHCCCCHLSHLTSNWLLSDKNKMLTCRVGNSMILRCSRQDNLQEQSCLVTHQALTCNCMLHYPQTLYGRLWNGTTSHLDMPACGIPKKPWQHNLYPWHCGIIAHLLKNWSTGQENKLAGHGYGQLAERYANASPWALVGADLIGPYTVQAAGQEYNFQHL